MSDVHCIYCGSRDTSISLLTNYSCNKNPNGQYHVPYEGAEKDKYTCKYCGSWDTSISLLTANSCNKSPSKYHIPSIH